MELSKSIEVNKALSETAEKQPKAVLIAPRD